MKMSRLGLARTGQLSYNFKQSGNPENCHNIPRSGFSTQVLLYSAETWTITKVTVAKVQTFINSCLRRILRVHWPDKISNISLWERAQQILAERETGRRKWRWIGHTLRKPVASSTRRALSWNPQGKRRRGRPRNSWRRDLLADSKRMGITWNQLEAKA